MVNKNHKKGIEQKLIDFCFGDNDAFAFLFQSWQTELFFYTYHFLKNEEETEDVMHDCFEKILKTNVQYRVDKFIHNEINIKAYIKVVLKNRALDVLKTKSNRRRITQNINHLFSKFSLNGAEVIENKDFLLQLLKPLKERDRDIFLLHLQGYTLEEIGAKYFLSKKTISNIITNSKKQLKLGWNRKNNL